MSSISFSTKRIGKLAGLFVVSLLLPAVCGILRGARADELIVWSFISAICFLCFGFYVEHERWHGKTLMGNADNYTLLSFVYLVGLVFSCVAAFLPAYTAPVMAVAMLCAGIFPDQTGCALAIYFALLSAVFCESGTYVGAAYALLAIAGIFLTGLFAGQKDYIWSGMLIVSMSVVIPACCSYLETYAMDFWTIVRSLVGSTVTLLTLCVLPKIQERMGQAQDISLDTVMNPHYHLQQAIEQYSSVDFEHAKHVSEVSAKLARELGADEKLAMAGGFYYRIGKMEGEPFVENGVRIAQQNFFPERLVEILAEYNGVNQLPSTLESALVQISDMIVTKFDVLDKDTFSAGWNRDIVIYQTMNEKSAEGMYDKSGLSMNQFLKVRDLLVAEEELLR